MIKNMYQHAETVLGGLKVAYPYISRPDQQIAFTGMVVVAAVTSYEIEIRHALFEFVDSREDEIFSVFAHEHWKRTNGRISYAELSSKYLKCFGEQYEQKFKTISQQKNDILVRQHKINAINSYGQILSNRNSFVHNGMSNSINLTFDEALKDYEEGKHVIEWFSSAIL